MENKRDNSGVLFKSETREKESQPHYKGNITVAGVDYWISAWIKEGKNGKFMGLAVNPKDAQPAANPKKIVYADDDIPF